MASKQIEIQKFREWAKKWCHDSNVHPDATTLIVSVYASTYPGRVEKLLVELISQQGDS